MLSAGSILRYAVNYTFISFTMTMALYLTLLLCCYSKYCIKAIIKDVSHLKRLFLPNKTALHGWKLLILVTYFYSNQEQCFLVSLNNRNLFFFSFIETRNCKEEKINILLSIAHLRWILRSIVIWSESEKVGVIRIALHMYSPASAWVTFLINRPSDNFRCLLELPAIELHNNKTNTVRTTLATSKSSIDKWAYKQFSLFPALLYFIMFC